MFTDSHFTDTIGSQANDRSNGRLHSGSFRNIKMLILSHYEGRINRRNIICSRVETESGGTRRSTGGEMKGKEANGVGSQLSCTVSEHGLSSITTADAHTSAASSRMNWHPRRYKWTRPFRWKNKSGFCACAITFRFHSTTVCHSTRLWVSSIQPRPFRRYLPTCSIFKVGVYQAVSVPKFCMHSLPPPLFK